MTTLDALYADFELIDDWEERYKYVIELGRGLPVLDEALKTPATKVAGCASQVWIYTSVEQRGTRTGLKLQGDSDALIVKGLIAVAFAMFEPLTLSEIMAFDAQGAFARLGFKDNLTPQRSNGLAAMVARIKADAARGLAQ